MVIFCGKSSYEAIERARRPLLGRTRIHVVEYDEFLVAKHREAFEKQRKLLMKNAFHGKKRIPFRKNYSARLFMIWNEKINFLHRAASENPFNTKLFLFADIALLRKLSAEEMASGRFKKWPNAQKLAEAPHDKMLLFRVDPFKKKWSRCRRQRCLPYFRPYYNKIIAGSMGGTQDAIQRFHTEYYAMLAYFLQTKRWAGQEQQIIDAVCLINSDMCYIVVAPRGRSQGRSSFFHSLDYFMPP
ncbi:unnamed protein product [Vitrella brassicaformis CCMP3155]|uniref:Uncharacterized protein n=1 Tax=Vitrella brassicaformis (strain CCMP3155) TaxID=1169540 RepID=A0A0G4EKV5_VITBC|nr:unnamed protein product [Vitrella brassicaformis CCMP3155]|eukprot:CEL97140.1 unnamed protein product [Vitrella brassicaformis CCMP3155]